MHCRVALITGGSRGIGKGIAIALAEAGCAVVLVSRTNKYKDEIENEFVDLKLPKPLCLEADVSDHKSMKLVMSIVQDHFGRLDIVCANAGIFPCAELESLSSENIDDIFSVNVKGTILTVQAALPMLKKSPAGRVIIPSSITEP